MSLNMWTALKAPFAKRALFTSAAYSGPAADIAIDNGFQNKVFDPNGGAMSFLQPAGTTRSRTHLNNPNGTSVSGQISAVSAPTVTPTGGTATTWAYKIVGRVSNGTTPASSAGQTTTGGATLSSTVYNTITWTLVTGCLYYDIYRTTASGTPSTTGYIGTVSLATIQATNPSATTGSFVDYGIAGDSTTAPTLNTTSVFETTLCSDISVQGLATPQGLTVTPTGTTGGTTYGYRVSAVTAVGTEAPCAEVTTSTGNATLSTTNYNALSFYMVPGAVSYYVYRSTGGATQGYIGTVSAASTAHATALTFSDTGIAATGSVPTTNTTGSITTTGGIAQTTTSANQGKHFYAGTWVPASSTAGTDTAGINGTIWISEVFVPASCQLTGIAYLLGSVGGTDKVVVALFDAAGNVVANSALDSSVTAGTSATFQRVPFTTPYRAVGPAKYYVGVQFNGTTAKIRTQVFGNHDTTSISQTFNTLVAITPPTSFTASVGPVSMLY